MAMSRGEREEHVHGHGEASFENAGFGRAGRRRRRRAEPRPAITLRAHRPQGIRVLAEGTIASRMTATPWTAASMIPSSTSGRDPAGNAPLLSPSEQRVHLQPNRTQESEPRQPLIRGTERSRKIQAEVLWMQTPPNSYTRISPCLMHRGHSPSAPGGGSLQGRLTDQTGETPLRPARRCRPCSEVPVDSQPGCIRSGRQSSASRRSDTLRDQQTRARHRELPWKRLPVPFLTFFQTQLPPPC